MSMTSGACAAYELYLPVSYDCFFHGYHISSQQNSYKFTRSTKNGYLLAQKHMLMYLQVSLYLM